jgi:hypothetical protein
LVPLQLAWLPSFYLYSAVQHATRVAFFLVEAALVVMFSPEVAAGVVGAAVEGADLVVVARQEDGKYGHKATPQTFLAR